MKRLALGLMLVLCSLGTAAAADVPVTIVQGEGFLFPVYLEVDLGMKSWKQVRFDSGKKSLELPAGNHTLEVRNWRFGFPQEAEYEVLEHGKTAWKSQPTVDPRAVTLKDGQSLTITVGKPYEPYEGRFFALNGIACGIILPRPYWFQDVQRKWEAKEDYPNTLFFMLDEEKWGPEKAFANLAAEMKKRIDSGDADQGDYRADCHVSCNIALSSDGTVPEGLKKATEAELTKAMLAAYKELLGEKCYRTFPAPDVEQLKKAGFLPADTKAGRLTVPVSKGIEYAKPLFLDWKKRNAK